MEDMCVTCQNNWRKSPKIYHIDIWLNSDQRHEQKVIQCQHKWTRESITVEVDPPPTKPVNTNPLFNPEGGSCL